MMHILEDEDSIKVFHLIWKIRRSILIPLDLWGGSAIGTADNLGVASKLQFTVDWRWFELQSF